MKTRIKIVEYNSGKKEFICQQYQFELPNFFISIFLLIFRGTYIPNWVPLYKNLEYTSVEPAVFQLEEEAKKFLDDLHEKQKKIKREEFMKKIKSTTYEKYP